MQDKTDRLELTAPLSGVLVPLDQVPDPVFAQKMVGDGVSIDPLSETLLAPCDGEVTHVHPAGHAVTLEALGGVEIMLHVGVDTVNLKGEGFAVKVEPGQKVASGAELIAFDADFLATRAKSLLTQMVISDMDRVADLEAATGLVTAGDDVVLRLDLAVGAETGPTIGGDVVKSDPITVPNSEGLHARPAAVLANLAKRFQADIRIQRGGQEGNARSVTSIMKLNIVQNDQVVLVASGSDAGEAIAAIAPHLASGLGDEGHVPAPAPATVVQAEKAAPVRRPVSDDPKLMMGVAASPGLAVGKVMQVRRTEIEVKRDGADPATEKASLGRAIDEARGQLEVLRARLHAEADPAKAAIFAAHVEILEDPELENAAAVGIAEGRSAGFAWKQAYETEADTLMNLGNELLAQRATDIRDVGQRVLQILAGVQGTQREFAYPCILIAEDLTPSDTATLDREVVRGFCTTLGGTTSHVSILARSLGIPAVAGIDPRVLDLPDEAEVILDGTRGSLRIDPTPEQIERIRTAQEKLEAKRQADLAAADQPAVTSDGQTVGVFANIGGQADAEQVGGLGGEGVGLLRSEFLFMQRTDAPSEDEQTEAYGQIVAALGEGRPLVIRTLDVGGDKPLAYLPLPGEDNPFLGERGIRFQMDRPELMRTQLRAILRAAQGGTVHAMFPMVATLDEWRLAKSVLDQEAAGLGVESVKAGIMVEVPSTAVQAEAFAREVDFFSIGTNDLTQYVLAMDRGHPKLAARMDGLNPAVLALIKTTVEGGHAHGCRVEVCGGLASDLAAVPILIGLGVDELSVSLPAIPAVKALIREWSLEDCRALAERALAADTAEDVRAMSPSPLEEIIDDGSSESGSGSQS